MEVIGDESKYSVYRSGDFRNLFISPKVDVGEFVEISLSLAGGLTQDMRFTVGDTTAQTIFINVSPYLSRYLPTYSSKDESNATVNIDTKATKGATKIKTIDMGPIATENVEKVLMPIQSPIQNQLLKTEISQMIRAMMEDAKDKYYVADNKRLLIATDTEVKSMQVSQVKSYRYKDLSGAVLNVKNCSGKRININEQDFKDIFKNVVAINIAADNLAPRANTRVLIVTKDGVNH